MPATKICVFDAGYLHDIGKLFIPDDILKKQGQLTDEELEIVKRYPVIGANCLKHAGLFQGRGGIEEMVLNHQPSLTPWSSPLF